MSNDTLRPILKNQYHAALAMLRKSIGQCPDDLWLAEGHTNAYWQIAYHVLYFTHLYLHPDDASFAPWEHHQDDVEYPSAVKGGYANEGQTRQLPTPYTKAQVLEYWALCDGMVEQAIDAFDLDAPTCGFWWYKMGKLEHQFVNIRHIQHHAAQLSDRLRRAADIGVGWVGSGRGN